MTLDLSILEWIQRVFSSPIMNTVMVSVTKLGDNGFIWIVMVLLFLTTRKTRILAVGLALVLLVELGLVEGFIKLIVQRPRPFTEVDIHLLIPAPNSTSFPSGHTASSFAAAGYLLFLKRKEAPLALFLAVIIAFSRLYLFVHYPTDVLGGGVLGLLLGYLGSLLYTRILYPKLISVKWFSETV